MWLYLCTSSINSISFFFRSLFYVFFFFFDDRKAMSRKPAVASVQLESAQWGKKRKYERRRKKRLSLCMCLRADIDQFKLCAIFIDGPTGWPRTHTHIRYTHKHIKSEIIQIQNFKIKERKNRFLLQHFFWFT